MGDMAVFHQLTFVHQLMKPFSPSA